MASLNELATSDPGQRLIELAKILAVGLTRLRRNGLRGLEGSAKVEKPGETLLKTAPEGLAQAETKRLSVHTG